MSSMYAMRVAWYVARHRAVSTMSGELIQCSVHHTLAQHDDLRNDQQGVATGAIQLIYRV